MLKNTLFGTFLSGLVVVASVIPPPSSNTSLELRAPAGSKKVIIQLFGWNWESVGKECGDFIGPMGYGYVQVSPPAEHVTGGAWWTDYQPVSYNLNSKRGNRAQFAAMVSSCHNAGVKVIADTLFNHMAAMENGKGIGGSAYTHYSYPGTYSTADFHYCSTDDRQINSYYDRTQVQTCELAHLADLKTGSDYVRSRLAQYANDLLSLGVDGLRLDAAKHIPTGDIANILSRLTKKPYITQEVIFGDGEPVTPSEYTRNGDVQEFRFTRAVRSAFLGGNGISSLQNFDNRNWIASSQAQVFVENHDTEREGTSLNYKSPSNTYVSAVVFTLAHPYGSPSILSSYEFTSRDAGAPKNGAGSCSGTGGSNGWNCQHRWVAVTGMVGFRNTVGTAPMNNWVAPQAQRVAFGRGTAGFVVVNNADASWSSTFTTSLPNGVYCNVIAGPLSSGSCSGSSVTVTNGKFTATVSGRNTLAIHTNARR